MGKERGSRGKGARDRHSKKLKKFNEGEDVKEALSNIGTERPTYIFKKKRCPEDFDERFMETIPDDYVRLHYDQAAVQDKSDKKIALMTKFQPFDTMTIEERKDIEKLATTLFDASKRTNKIALNSSHQGGNGSMYAVGWRPGMDREWSMGRYMPSWPTQHSEMKMEKWVEDQEHVSTWMGELYRSRFSSMASKIFEEVSKQAKDIGVPDFSQLEFTNLEPKEGVFASNLTYTMNDFSNSFHNDDDHNTYAYGIWIPICSATGELAIISNGHNFGCQGGQFVVPTYKVYVDFNECDGITEIIWRGGQDFHATLRSTCTTGFTRLGTSVQISRKLVQRLSKVIREVDSVEDANEKVRGFQQILAKVKGI